MLFLYLASVLDTMFTNSSLFDVIFRLRAHKDFVRMYVPAIPHHCACDSI